MRIGTVPAWLKRSTATNALLCLKQMEAQMAFRSERNKVFEFIVKRILVSVVNVTAFRNRAMSAAIDFDVKERIAPVLPS